MREINCPSHAMRKVFIVVINAVVLTDIRDFVRSLRGQGAERY